MKKCSICKLDKSLDNFYSNGYTPKGTKKHKPSCKSCYDNNVELRLTDLIYEFFGEYCCKICGYDKCTKALEFHHIDPSLKEREISDMQTHSREKLFNELSKGIIVCANCHREIHDGMHSQYIVV